MSSSNTCANCGKEGIDVNNTCNKCNSVKYCNAACKKKHRNKHKKDCERRVAELHEQKLFKQPPQLLEDCPICFLQLPHFAKARTYMACCGKVLCSGCIHAVQIREAAEGNPSLCPFCRTLAPFTGEEMVQRYMKRMEVNDAIAIRNIGSFYAHGRCGLPQNMAKALELWQRAGELGDMAAYYDIGCAYSLGVAYMHQDQKKATHYWELAAIGGHVDSRYSLGAEEQNKGNFDRGLKHHMIATGRGQSHSLDNIKSLYLEGRVTKDDYFTALRSYQTFIDEVKSKQRDEAAAFDDDFKYY